MFKWCNWVVRWIDLVVLMGLTDLVELIDLIHLVDLLDLINLKDLIDLIDIMGRDCLIDVIDLVDLIASIHSCRTYLSHLRPLRYPPWIYSIRPFCSWARPALPGKLRALRYLFPLRHLRDPPLNLFDLCIFLLSSPRSSKKWRARRQSIAISTLFEKTHLDREGIAEIQKRKIAKQCSEKQISLIWGCVFGCVSYARIFPFNWITDEIGDLIGLIYLIDKINLSDSAILIAYVKMT